MNMIQIEKAGQTYNLYFDDYTIKVTQGDSKSEGISLSKKDADAMELIIAEEVAASKMEFTLLKRKGYMPC
jgi:hypothetical protein